MQLDTPKLSNPCRLMVIVVGWVNLHTYSSAVSSFEVFNTLCTGDWYKAQKS